MMNKIVNVFPTMGIMTLTPPITGVTYSAKMSLGDIEKCLLGRAKVEEILPDNSIIQLDLLNYKIDHTANINMEKIKADKAAKAEAERKAAEEAAKAEAERKAKAEAENERLRIEREQLEKAKAAEAEKEREAKVAEAEKKAIEAAKQTDNTKNKK